MDRHGSLTQQCFGIAARISANVKGGAAPGSNSVSLTFNSSTCCSSWSAIWTPTGVLTLSTEKFGRNFFDGNKLIELGKLEIGIIVLGLGCCLGSGLKPHSVWILVAI
ncbi:hypothetical protein HanPSC8_Chr05g0205101 [Helianthus annuus]|nr:hypothetical protein HanPSC8_Chr05g0205101 [Helianthus annuus]